MKKILIWISGVIGASFIGTIVNSLLSKINLWDSFLSIMKFLLKPDFGLLILILLSFLFLHKKIQMIDKDINTINEDIGNINKDISDRNIKEIISDNERWIEINDELRKKANKIIDFNEKLYEENKKYKEYEKIKYGKKMHFILGIIAEQTEGKMQFGKIKSSYFEKFREETSRNFNIVWNSIIRNRLLDQGRDASGYGGTEYYYITDKGYDYLKYQEFKSEKESTEN